MHCTLYIVRCTLYIIHYTLYIVHCTLYIVHCTLYIVQCTLYIIQCTLYNVLPTPGPDLTCQTRLPPVLCNVTQSQALFGLFTQDPIYLGKCGTGDEPVTFWRKEQIPDHNLHIGITLLHKAGVTICHFQVLAITSNN